MRFAISDSYSVANEDEERRPTNIGSTDEERRIGRGSERWTVGDEEEKSGREISVDRRDISVCPFVSVHG